MTTNLRTGNILAALILLGGLGACTTQAAPTGTGGAGGAGTGGAGGETGIVCHPENNTANLAAGAGIACPKPAASGLIADFTKSPDAGVPDGGLPPRFGDDSTVLSGGGTTYANTPGTISQDTSGGDWHIQANVANYAGFSLYFDDVSVGGMLCNMVDATGFTGISFDIWGSSGGAITMSMGIVDDTPPPSWFQSVGATTSTMPVPAGACIPNANGMQYYHPGCGDPTAPAINVTGTVSAPQTVTFKWTDFVSGDCKPNVIPSQIVSVAWQFAWSTAATPYAVDIHIDNLKFITN